MIPSSIRNSGRLAGAVGTEHAVDAAVRDAQADPVDRAGFAEILDQVAGLDGVGASPR